jgi:hypothetical protein
MDTRQFLEAVLPEANTYFLVKLKPQGAFHAAFNSIKDLASAALLMDKRLNEGESLSFGCSGYDKPFLVNEDGKKEYRSNANWSGAKCFWVDVDVGKAGCYDTIKEATGLCKNLFEFWGIPSPLYIKSGYGLHLYWALDRTITSLSEWKSYASLLKSVLMGIGLKFDVSKTADPKAVLRPVGTFNRKIPSNPQPVRLLHETLVGSEVYLDTFIQRFKHIAQQEDIAYEEITEFDLLEVPTWAQGTDNKLVHRIYDLSYGERVLERCNQIKYLAEVGGDVDYNLWWRMLGVAKFLHDGERFAHEWSANSPHYDEAQTNYHLSTWKAGPTSCAEFKDKNPDGCKGCVHNVTSPIVLGRCNPEVAPDVSHLEPEQAEKLVAELPKLPENYTSVGGKMYKIITIEGEKQHVEFSRSLLYITGRQKDLAGTFSTTWRMHPPHKDDEPVEFTMPNAYINSKKDMVKKLGEHDILLNDTESTIMAAYLRDSVEKLRVESRARTMREKFGWQLDGAFLYGNDIYTTDGEIKPVVISQTLQSFIGSFFTPPQGSMQTYLDAMHSVYNRPSMEPFQYVIASTYGSLLNNLVGDTYSGIMLAFAGSNSGRGKTSVCKAAMYGFGTVNNASSCMIVGDGQGQGATTNARVLMLSSLCNFPVIFDEFSNKEPDEIRQLCYEVANGASKAFATKNRELVNGGTFQMSPIITGNADFHEAIQIGKGKAAAESVRLLQIYIDHYNTVDFSRPEFGGNFVGRQLQVMAANTGWIGRAFTKYMMANLPKVKDLLEKYSAVCSRVVLDPAHRFYRYHVACTLTAAHILIEELALFKFDMAILESFALRMLATNIRNVAGMVKSDFESLFSSMINELMPRIYCTKDYHDGRTITPELVYGIHAVAVGRWVIGSPSMEQKEWSGRLILSIAAVAEWCQKNNVDKAALLAWTEENKFLVKQKDNRCSLTKGTTAPPVSLRAYVFQMDKPVKQGLVGVPPLAANE